MIVAEDGIDITPNADSARRSPPKRIVYATNKLDPKLYEELPSLGP